MRVSGSKFAPDLDLGNIQCDSNITMTVTSNLVKNGIRLLQHFDRQRISPAIQQRSTLQYLLRRAESTAFGQHYRFPDLLRSPDYSDAFRKTVGLYDYDSMFNDWWHRCLAGEADVTWKGHVRHFALSSGTSGAPSKYIPVTQDMRRCLKTGAFRMFACMPKYDLPADFYTKEWLMIGSTSTLQDLGHCYAGDLSGINASEPPVWIRRFYRPGTQIARIPNWDERTEVIAQNAYKWDISLIAGTPSWMQLTVEHILDHYGLDSLHQLWKNLSVVVTGGTSFEPYRKSFERLLDRPLIHQETYMASEGFIAFQDRPDGNMRLLLNNGIFFEFMPFDDAHFDESGAIRPNVEPLTIEEIQEGKDYALLLSTCSGAWRYLIGDVVRFTDKERAEIIVTGRTKHFLSICGEHLSVDNMTHAILKVEDKLNVGIPEFTVSGVQAGSHHAHRWYIGTNDPIVDKELVGRLLDEELCLLNDDYRVERSAMLQRPQVEIVPVSYFYDWHRQTGKMNGQSKTARVLKGETFEAWERFICQKRQTT